MVEENLLCNFLTITIYAITSIYILRKRTTFELFKAKKPYFYISC